MKKSLFLSTFISLSALALSSYGQDDLNQLDQTNSQCIVNTKPEEHKKLSGMLLVTLKKLPKFCEKEGYDPYRICVPWGNRFQRISTAKIPDQETRRLAQQMNMRFRNLNDLSSLLLSIFKDAADAGVSDSLSMEVFRGIFVTTNHP